MEGQSVQCYSKSFSTVASKKRLTQCMHCWRKREINCSKFNKKVHTDKQLQIFELLCVAVRARKLKQIHYIVFSIFIYIFFLSRFGALPSWLPCQVGIQGQVVLYVCLCLCPDITQIKKNGPKNIIQAYIYQVQPGTKRKSEQRLVPTLKPIKKAFWCRIQNKN